MVIKQKNALTLYTVKVGRLFKKKYYDTPLLKARVFFNSFVKSEEEKLSKKKKCGQLSLNLS